MPYSFLPFSGSGLLEIFANLKEEFTKKQGRKKYGENVGKKRRKMDKHRHSSFEQPQFCYH